MHASGGDTKKIRMLMKTIKAMDLYKYCQFKFYIPEQKYNSIDHCPFTFLVSNVNMQFITCL